MRFPSRFSGTSFRKRVVPIASSGVCSLIASSRLLRHHPFDTSWQTVNSSVKTSLGSYSNAVLISAFAFARTSPVQNRRGKQVQVYRFFTSLPINVGKTMHKQCSSVGAVCIVHGMPLKEGDFLIVATPHYITSARNDYAERWTIELLFGCLTSRGFNAEDTHLTKPRTHSNSHGCSCAHVLLGI